MKKFLITIPFLFLAAACNKQSAQVQPVQNQQAEQPQGTATDKVVNDKIYVNDKYGFELTFSDVWNGYKAGGVYGTNNSYVPFSVADKSGKYSNQFSILIYPKSEWSKLTKKDGINFITENNNNVYAYQLSLDSGYKLTNLNSEVTKVVSTFKLTSQTSNWKTYISNTLNFSINYPSNWSVDTNRSSTNEVVFNNGVVESHISVSVQPYTKTLNDWVNSLDKKVVTDTKPVTIDGQSGTEFFSGEVGGTYGEAGVIYKGNLFLFQSVEIMKQAGMLDTFKFIK